MFYFVFHALKTIASIANKHITSVKWSRLCFRILEDTIVQVMSDLNFAQIFLSDLTVDFTGRWNVISKNGQDMKPM